MTNPERKVRVEFVGDINTEYPYLEVFMSNSTKPFMEIGVTTNKELYFKYWSTKVDIDLCVGDVEYLLATAKDFLPEVIKNEEDNRRFNEG